MIRNTLRERCAFLSATGAALALASGAAAQTAPVRSEPLSETIHGITLADEYRWMEDDANREELLAFVEAENARTRAMLDALPERAWFDQRLGEISSNLDRISGYMRCGPTELFRRSGANDRLPKLMIRDAAGERPFLDPVAVGGDALSSFGAIEFAPDCRRVSVQVSTGGSEMGRTLLFDVGSGRQIGAAIERIWARMPCASLEMTW